MGRRERGSSRVDECTTRNLQFFLSGNAPHSDSLNPVFRSHRADKVPSDHHGRTLKRRKKRHAQAVRAQPAGVLRQYTARAPGREPRVQLQQFGLLKYTALFTDTGDLWVLMRI